MVGSCAVGVLGALGTAALASGAAATGWSATPSGGMAGSSVHVSSDGVLCVWDVTAPDGGSVTRYEGSRVELRLERAGTTRAMGVVSVRHGGLWSGTLRIPAVSPGTYAMVGRCIVDDPTLGATKAFDVGSVAFTVQPTAPPTTTPTPPPVIPPVVATSSTTRAAGASTVRVPATRITRRATATLPLTGPAPATLPNTGGGTLGVALAGLGSLTIGGVALWWGGRKRPVPTDTKS